MSISHSEENQGRDRESLDELLPDVCAERGCHSQRGLRLVISGETVPTGQMLCRPHRKKYWGVSS
jgi:hypothetical protein